MLTSNLGFLIFAGILFQAENILCEDSTNHETIFNLGSYVTTIPKEKCLSFKIKTTSFFRLKFGFENDDKKFSDLFNIIISYKYDVNNNSTAEIVAGSRGEFLPKYILIDLATNLFINPNDYNEFWVKLHDDIVQVGLKSNSEPFITYKYFMEFSHIKIKPGSYDINSKLSIPEHFECPKNAIKTKHIIVNFGRNGNYLMPTPKTKCLTFKIKTESFFRLYFGIVNDINQFIEYFYVYMGYKYDDKPGQYSGLYDHSIKTYTIYDRLTPNLLNKTNYQEFFLKWENNEFEIGLLNDAEPLMKHIFIGNAENLHIQIAPIDQDAVLVIPEDGTVCPLSSAPKIDH